MSRFVTSCFVTYKEILTNELPDGLIWHVPRRHQGQHHEIAFANPRWPRLDADVGDPYKRETSSDKKVTYYLREKQ